ncbi:MAG: hypothetical protein Kow0067_18050 [Coriobacteriia bacterium]
MRRRADGTSATSAGVGFLAYALGFTLVRLGNHFLRARQPVVTAPEWFYPVFYPALAAVIVGLLWFRLRRLRPTRARDHAPRAEGSPRRR